MTRNLGRSEGRLRSRVVKLARVLRHDRLHFWLQVHIVAEAGLTRWEALRLDRLARLDDPRLVREADEIRLALQDRHLFVNDLGDRLASELETDLRLGLLDRLRLVQRTRLRTLMEELEGLLAAYGPDSDVATIQPPVQPEQLPAPEESFDWESLVVGLRRRAGAPIRYLGATGKRVTRAASERWAGGSHTDGMSDND